MVNFNITTFELEKQIFRKLFFQIDLTPLPFNVMLIVMGIPQLRGVPSVLLAELLHLMLLCGWEVILIGLFLQRTG